MPTHSASNVSRGWRERRSDLKPNNNHTNSNGNSTTTTTTNDNNNNNNNNTAFTAKSTDRTVFVRFIPPSSNIRRQHLEALFSEVGPIKKSAVIVHKAKTSSNNNDNNDNDNDTNDVTTSTTTSPPSSYGFVKYTRQQDAELAAQLMQNQRMIISDQESVIVKVELASSAAAAASPSSSSSSVGAATAATAATATATSSRHGSNRQGSRDHRRFPTHNKTASTSLVSATVGADPVAPVMSHNKDKDSRIKGTDAGHAMEESELEPFQLQKRKKHCRVIVRNLSFYAKESHIRQALESRFGPIVDVHIPTVTTTTLTTTTTTVNNSKRKTTTTADADAVVAVPTTHRGFCFVTFEHAEHAAAAVSQPPDGSNQDPILVYHRPVTIEPCLAKTVYQQQQHRKQQPEHLSNDNNYEKKQHTATDRNNPDVNVSDDNDDHSLDEGADEESNEVNNSEENDSDDTDDAMDDDDDASNDSHDDLDDEDNNNESHVPTAETEDVIDPSQTAIREQRQLFVRNLPFDTVRHDLFQVFRLFGHVQAIYIVRQADTAMPKGTAFVTFTQRDAAQRALLVAAGQTSISNHPDEATTITTVAAVLGAVGNATAPPLSSSSSSSSSSMGLFRLSVTLAVDKETASTLALEKTTLGHNPQRPVTGTNANSSSSTTTTNRLRMPKDRRNLYLQNEGRVDNTPSDPHAWDQLPFNDQRKRQTAWSEKLQKLKSPLFFIHPSRLCVRNLAKHIDESDLKQLCVTALQRGLGKHTINSNNHHSSSSSSSSMHQRVSMDDVVAHWRAAGEMSTRDIVDRIQRAANDSTTNVSGDNSSNNNNNNINDMFFFPPFDPANVKGSIRSVFIQRDFISAGHNNNNTNKTGTSRGFGFVEFQHHIHALAVLRELNNNLEYSAEYVAGGKHAIQLQQQQQKRRRGNKKKKKKPLQTRKRFVDDNVKNESDDVDEETSGIVHIPRLIVEFTVENKIKARQQAEHRAQKQANAMQQKYLHQQQQKTKEQQQKQTKKEQKQELNDNHGGDDDDDDDNNNDKKLTAKKLGRGAKQRERKRRQQQQQPQEQTQEQKEEEEEERQGLVFKNGRATVSGGRTGTRNEQYAKGSMMTYQEQQQQQVKDEQDHSGGYMPQHHSVLSMKPPPKKKTKIDPDEVHFTRLVATYRDRFLSLSNSASSLVHHPQEQQAGSTTLMKTAADRSTILKETGKRWFES